MIEGLYLIFGLYYTAKNYPFGLDDTLNDKKDAVKCLVIGFTGVILWPVMMGIKSRKGDKE
jgi:hypothetical protein